MARLLRPSLRALFASLVALVVGCAEDDERVLRPTEALPRVVSAAFTESVAAPLAGTLKVTVDRAATVTVVATEPGGHRLELTSTAVATEHEIPVIGLRAARAYALTVTATDGSGVASGAWQGERRTTALPMDFPPLQVVAADKARPGLTLFPVGRFGATGVDRWGYLVAVDAAGEVVWYASTYATLADVQRGARGQIRYMFDEHGIAEITPLGTIERALIATGPKRDGAVPAGFTGVAADTLHHDVVELPNGHWLTLATEGRTLTKTECSTYDKSYDVIADVVVELDPSSGEVLSRVSMFDLLDPCRRVDPSFKSAFWAPVYGVDSADWTHANSVFYDASRNAVLVSLRHQDWVVAYRYADDAGGKAGSLLWKLGPDGDFALAGEGALFPHHQHAARVLPGGHVSLFDNGTTRPGTDDLDITLLPSSRAVEYALDMTGDRSTWKATQVWEYGQREVRQVDAASGKAVGWYAPVVGDSVYTPEGTVVITAGAVMTPANGFVLDPAVKKSARIVEVERGAAAKVVFDLRVHDPDAAGFDSYLVYRATRVPTLIPPGTVTAKVTIP